MTEITAYDKRGNVVYHYSTPQALSQEEIERDLREWGVSAKQHTVKVNNEIWNENK